MIQEGLVSVQEEIVQLKGRQAELAAQRDGLDRQLKALAVEQSPAQAAAAIEQQLAASTQGAGQSAAGTGTGGGSAAGGRRGS